MSKTSIVALVLESMEPGNLHTGIYWGLRDCGVPVYPIVLPRDDGQHQEWRSRLLRRLLRQLPTRFIITVGPNDHLEEQAFDFPGTYIVSIQVDDPWALDHKRLHLPIGCREILTSCPADTMPERYRCWAGNSDLRVHYLRFGVDLRVFRPMPVGPPEYRGLFIGTAYHQRRQMVEVLQRRGVPIQCLGPGNSPAWDNKRLPAWEIPLYYSLADVCISFSDQPDGVVSQKIRPYEIAASGGGCLLVQREPTACAEFDEETAVFFDTVQELQDRLQSLLDDPPRRQRLTQSALKLARAKFSWESRLRPHVERWKEIW